MRKIALQKIVAVRLMNAEEAEFEGWGDQPRSIRPIVLVLANGIKLYASRDPEGNGPGELFGIDGMLSFTVTSKEYGHDPKKG